MFSTPRDLVCFLDRARRLAGGKPTGLKLCVGSRCDVLAVCRAMLEEHITPDFIVADGSDGGTGTGPLEFRRPPRNAADYTNSARAMMFALGWIQAQRCYTNTCPAGVATQEPRRSRVLVVGDTAARVRRYQEATVHSALQVGFDGGEQLS